MEKVFQTKLLFECIYKVTERYTQYVSLSKIEFKLL